MSLGRFAFYFFALCAAASAAFGSVSLEPDYQADTVLYAPPIVAARPLPPPPSPSRFAL